MPLFGACLLIILLLLVHSACGHCGSGGSLFLDVGNKALGCKNHCSNGSRILKSGACYLCRINDTGRDHVAVGLVVSVETVADFSGANDLVKDNASLQTCVSGDLANRFLKSLENDSRACLFVSGKL